jgi:hypothetical protein
MSFVRVNSGEVEIGQPVPWALYDDGSSCCLPGVVVETETQKRALMERGLFRKLQISETKLNTESGGDKPSESSFAFDDITARYRRHPPAAVPGRHCPVALLRQADRLSQGQEHHRVTPSQDGKVLLMREGQGFVVRMFSGKSVYAFGTTIYKVANVPFPICI